MRSKDAVSRRGAIKLLAGGISVFSAGACAGLLGFREAFASERRDLFPQGVASGDPSTDRVMLWTRLKPTGVDTPVTVQVAGDQSFQSPIAEVAVVARTGADYTVRCLLTGLRAGTTYYYRFLTPEGFSSRVGRTWTAPASQEERTVRIAVFSCQAYQAGYFGAYRHFLIEDANNPRPTDLVLHVGDYIYEYLGDGNSLRSVPIEGGARSSDGRRFAESLEEYRAIYRAYHTDADLQDARALYPFVCVWDDHEFAQNGFQTCTGGTFQQRRKLAANRAWFEYVPAIIGKADSRSPDEERVFDDVLADSQSVEWDSDLFNVEEDSRKAINSLTIFRRVRWGATVDLLLTDTRSYKSPSAVAACSELNIAGNHDLSLAVMDPVAIEALALGRHGNGGSPPASVNLVGTPIANPRTSSPPVTMLGRRQREWLLESFAESKAAWRVWGNPTPLTPFVFDFGAMTGGVKEGIVWADGWDGFPNERSEILGFLRARGITNVISLSGDRHMQSAALVPTDWRRLDGPKSIPEVICTGVSAPTRARIMAMQAGRDENLRSAFLKPPSAASAAAATLNMTLRHGVDAARRFANDGTAPENDRAGPNPHLGYVDSDAHGYVIASFGSGKASIDLVTVELAVRNYGAAGPKLMRRAKFEVPSWTAGTEPSLKLLGVEGIGVLGGAKSV